MYKSLRSMLLMVTCAVCGSVLAQDNLKAMQQKFVNEKFGMFIHSTCPHLWTKTGPTPTCRLKPSTRRNWTVTNGPKLPLVQE